MARHDLGNPLGGEVLLIDSGSGTGKILGAVSGHVEDLIWGSDGASILALSADQGADMVVTAGAIRYTPPSERDRPVVHLPGAGRRRLYEIKSSSVRELGPGTGTLWNIALCADGTIAVNWSTDASESGWYDSLVGVLDRDSGLVQPRYEPEWQISALAAAPSGSRVAFVEGWASDRGKVCGEIRVLEVSDGSLTAVPWFDVDVTTIQWRDDSSIWFAGWQGLEAVWGWVGDDGVVGTIRSDPILPESLRLSCGTAEPPVVERAWAFSQSEDGSNEEVVATDALEGPGGWVGLTRLGSEGLSSFCEVRTQRLSWESRDGTSIDGTLALPARPGSALPLVLYLHGGPAGIWSGRLSPEIRFLVDSGFSVLLPNPRGSVGRGQRFARANLGDPGGEELHDLLAGVEACDHLPEVDSRMVGVLGGSYGGYLAACAATMTDRFACAVMMYGHPDLLSARFGSNNAAFYDKLMDGRPSASKAMEYVQRSPIVHVTAKTAPTLIIHGQEDRCCPIGQAEEMYRALQEAGISTQLIAYPGEGHGLHGIGARGDCWDRTAAWLSRHLKGEQT